MTRLELLKGQRDACLRNAAKSEKDALEWLRQGSPHSAESAFKNINLWVTKAAKYQAKIDKLTAPVTLPWWRKLPIPCHHRETQHADE